MADTKISNLARELFSDINQIVEATDDIIIPASIGNSNRGINLINIATLIRSYIELIVASNTVSKITNDPNAVIALKNALGIGSSGGQSGGGSSGGLSGGGASQAEYELLYNKVVALENIMYTPSAWPVHTIKLANGQIEISNLLPCGPNSNSGIITIPVLLQMDLPNFYVKVIIAGFVINASGKIEGTATVTFYGSNQGLTLLGGNPGLIEISGSANVSTGNITGTYSISGSLDTTGNDLANVVADGQNSLTITLLSLDEDRLLEDTVIVSATAVAVISGVQLTGNATYSASNNTSMGAQGYITLPVNNGS